MFGTGRTTEAFSRHMLNENVAAAAALSESACSSSNVGGAASLREARILELAERSGNPEFRQAGDDADPAIGATGERWVYHYGRGTALR